MRIRALPLAGTLVVCACLTGRQPPLSVTGRGALRSYVLVIPAGDALGSTLANLLRDRGFRVWSGVRGGSGPAAALVSFTFRDASSESGRWLYARFFDTRTGVIVAAASVPLDTLANDPRVHARALFEALLAELAGSVPH
jgi:hypothetical protein